MEVPKLDEKCKRLIEFIEPNPKDKILVIGTGIFPKIEFYLYNQFKCEDITSGDVNRKNIVNGEKILPQIKFLFLDAQKKFPFKNNSFDKVIFTEVLEHLKNEDMALKEIKRVLKKNGKLILSVPKRRWFNELFSPVTRLQHKREYKEERIKIILNKNGFKIEKKFIGGIWYELPNLWLHLILKYFFNTLHVDFFFQEKIDKAYKKDFKGRGTDIIIRVRNSRS